MSVTDEDRERAKALLFRSGADNYGVAVDYVAQALAAEREKARAPFLALAERFGWDTMREPDWTGTQVAEAIRLAAQES